MTFILILYLVILSFVFAKQYKFLSGTWERDFKSKAADPRSSLYFTRELEEMRTRLDCRRPVHFYSGLPKEFADFDTLLISRYALSPCYVVFHNEAPALADLSKLGTTGPIQVLLRPTGLRFDSGGAGGLKQIHSTGTYTLLRAGP